MPRIDFTRTPGDYTYGQDEHGKYAYGVVKSGATSERDPAAQRAAGGADREQGDHGGHLIPHAAGGRNDPTNLDAQNGNVNQRGQARLERDAIQTSRDPDKTVYMSVQNYTRSGSQRPDATMITTASYDHKTGNVDVQHNSLQNASYKEQAEWAELANQNDRVDPRQDAGMTPDQRALANEYAGYEISDDRLGTGSATFYNSDTAPITPGDDQTVDQGTVAGESGNDEGEDEGEDDGMSY